MKKNIRLIIGLIIISVTAISGNEFNIAVTSLDLTLNPFYTYTADEAQYLSGLYEGLVSYGAGDLIPQPAIAENWTLSEDKKTYTFKIRENAVFSNGDKITSKIFKESFIKILSPDSEAEFASLLDIIENALEYRSGTITDSELVGISADDDQYLKITLKQRAPYFTKILCHHSFTPIHPSLIDKKVWDIEDVIYSGPYMLSRHSDRLTLKRNSKYWDNSNVFFDTINLIDFKESSVATEAFNKGTIDWLTDSTIDLNKIADIETLKINPLFATTYYYFNPNYKEYSNSEVRKAISLLIPWNNIREKQYIPADSLVPNLKNFPKNRKNYEQNIEEALKILEKEGYKNGKGVSNLLLSIPENTYNDKLISQLIKENIEQNTEIKVIINTTPYPDFFSVNKDKPFTLSTLSWIGDFADPLTFLEMWTTESNLNDSGYSDVEYDNMIINSSNLDQNERYLELSKAEKKLLEETIVIPINHSPGINVIDTRFYRNWYPNTLNIHPYKFIKISEKQVIPGLI